ncbi:MAG: hypothetical protein ABW189_03590 [Rickettsiales bacterium]
MLPPEVQLKSDLAAHVSQPFSAAAQGITAALPTVATPVSPMRLRMLDVDRGLSASAGLIDGVMEAARTVSSPGHGSFREMIGFMRTTKSGLSDLITQFCPALAPVMPFLNAMHFIHIFMPSERAGPGMINARSLSEPAAKRDALKAKALGRIKKNNYLFYDRQHREREEAREKEEETRKENEIVLEENRRRSQERERKMREDAKQRNDLLGYDRNLEREDENVIHLPAFAKRSASWCEHVDNDRAGQTSVIDGIRNNRARLAQKCSFLEEGREM